jgi:signal peptidase II
MGNQKFSWSLAFSPLPLWVVGLIFVLDQLTKYWIIWTLRIGEGFSVLPFFEITHIKNKGAAFGIFHNSSPMFRIVFFGIVTLVCLYLLIYWLGTTSLSDRWQRIGLSLILGGALGNLKDRIVFGEVTDFLYIRYGEFYWPAFNIADAAISTGVAMILIQMIPWRRSKPFRKAS